MVRTIAWTRPGLVSLVTLLIIAVSCCWSSVSAARPGGDKGVRLTTDGSVVLDDGSILEEYELRESDPTTAHFVSLGSATHVLLRKSGYAFGPLVGITHSDRDKEYGEGPERKSWFPMVLVLHVLEEEGGGDGEMDVDVEVEVQYEVTLNYDPQKVAAPGLIILEARELATDGGVVASLTVLPPEATGFLEQNRAGITMMFGVIIASGVVKFLRRGMERLVKKAKQSGGEGDGSSASTAAATVTATPPPTREAKALGKGANPRKKKGGGTKQD